MGFTFKGGSSGSSDQVIAICNVGGREVKAIAKSFQSGGSEMQVISIEGVGKPTMFGAQKFCAIVEMQEAIAAHFKSLGQIG